MPYYGESWPGYQGTSDSKARHITGRPNVVADKLSRLGQTIQTVVSRGFPLYAAGGTGPNRLICHEVQQQVASVCVTGTGSPGHSSGCAQSAMVGSESIHLPTISHIGQSGGEVARLPMQEHHSNCSGVAQHALVLGSSGHVQPNPTEPANLPNLLTAIQTDPSQKSDKS